APLEPGEEGVPASFRLTVAQLNPQNLPVACRVDANRDERGARTHALPVAHLDHQRIGQNEGEGLLAPGALIPGADERVETGAQRGDGGLGEAGRAQLLSDGADFTRGDAVDHHLHEGQYQRLLASLIAGEELGENWPSRTWGTRSVSRPTREVSLR